MDLPAFLRGAVVAAGGGAVLWTCRPFCASLLVVFMYQLLQLSQTLPALDRLQCSVHAATAATVGSTVVCPRLRIAVTSPAMYLACCSHSSVTLVTYGHTERPVSRISCQSCPRAPIARRLCK